MSASLQDARNISRSYGGISYPNVSLSIFSHFVRMASMRIVPRNGAELLEVLK